MHEQEFERSVQKKMEELSFTPSAPVWERLEQELGTAKRRRRRLFLWMMPLLMVVGGTAFWWSQQVPGDIRQSAVRTAAPDGETGQSSDVALGSQPPRATSTNKHETATTKPAQPERNLPFQDKSALKSNVVAAAAKTTKKRQRTISSSTGTDVIASANAVIPEAPAGVTTTATEVALARTVAPVPLLESSPIATPKEQLGNAKNGTPVGPLPILPKRNRRQWSWSVQAQYGVAGVANGSFLKHAAPADALAGRPNLNNGPIVADLPSPVPQKGPMFNSGVQAQRRIAPRLDLYLGLSYQLHALQYTVGQRVNRATLPANLGVANRQAVLFRSTGPGVTYKSSYHLISLPAGILYEPFRRVPLQMQVGLAAGVLLGGKELQADTLSRLFYPVDSRVQRLQVQLQSGINYRLWQRHHWQLVAGPRFSYGITRLKPDGATGNGRLFSYGAGLQLHRRR